MPRPIDRAPLPPAPASGAGPTPILPPPPASLPAYIRPLYILPAAALLCAEHGSYYTRAALGRYLTEAPSYRPAAPPPALPGGPETGTYL
ncbi:hypothetical protein EJ08DRAFT_703350 [Tothia fuscella]|uniref:Uncharacterized protein n=1 Tax=Tothia fuscella TaxID=1048955 RepID=A0A9P4NEK9_9PEZI|nr:hypothetical protein EJ08DRAFT_703350 [Tothia fuscella]